MKTALFVAYECAPFQRPGSTIGAQRPHQFAKHLPKFGWSAIVLCCDYQKRYALNQNSDWKKAVREIIDKSLSTQNENSSLTIGLPSFQYANWIDKTWLESVNFNEALGNFSAKPGRLNLLKRKVSTAIKTFNGDHSESWQKIAVYATDYLISKGIKFTAQVAFHSPDACLHVCHANFVQHRIPWVIDFRDSLLAGRNKLEEAITKFMANKLAGETKAVINVSEYWASLDQITFPDKACYAIPNGFDPDDFNIKPESNHNHKLNLIYMGGVKLGQDFEILGKALHLLFEEDFALQEKISFQYLGPSKDRAEEVFNALQDSMEIHLFDNLPREEAIAKALGSDVLVLLTKKNESKYFAKGFYPGKVFEYLALNKPIIATPNDEGAIYELLKTTQTGESFSDPIALKDHLKTLIEQKLSGNLIFSSEAKDAVYKYSRENQTSMLADILNKHTLNA